MALVPLPHRQPFWAAPTRQRQTTIQRPTAMTALAPNLRPRRVRLLSRIHLWYATINWMAITNSLSRSIGFLVIPTLMCVIESPLNGASMEQYSAEAVVHQPHNIILRFPYNPQERCTPTQLPPPIAPGLLLKIRFRSPAHRKRDKQKEYNLDPKNKKNLSSAALDDCAFGL